MKKLSLEKTWEASLEMWKWISESDVGPTGAGAYEVKKFYLLETGKYKDVLNNCFFCEYAHQHNGFDNGLMYEGACCTKCPGCLVDKDFDCENFGGEVACLTWDNNPKEFYKLLVKLNKVRKAKLAKKGKKV